MESEGTHILVYSKDDNYVIIHNDSGITAIGLCNNVVIVGRCGSSEVIMTD